jgi:hypothetical protein
VKALPTFTPNSSSGRHQNDKRGKQKAEMNQGRLSVEFRDRTKEFASSIRLPVALPKDREEARTLGKQREQSGTSGSAHIRRALRTHSDEEFASKNFQRGHLLSAALRSRIILPFQVPIFLGRRKKVEILSCRTVSGSATPGRIANFLKSRPMLPTKELSLGLTD